MTSYINNRVSRLPAWRSNEPPEAVSEAALPRGPFIKPADFARVEEPAEGPVRDAAPVLEERIPSPLPVREPAVRDVREHETAETKPAADITPAVPDGAPLLDTRSVISAIWSRRLLILALAAAGAVLGAGVMPLLPKKFTAASTLYFDPRQVGLSDTSQNSVSPEMISTMIDSQVQILTSGKVLRRVADALKLNDDPEFGGGRGDATSAYLVADALQKALVIAREAGTYVVSLKATTKDPAKSARIANQVVTSFLQEENSASSNLYENTSSALDGRLTDLRQKVQDAEQAVETFRADNDMVTADGNLISDQRLTSLNALLVAAQDKTIQAKTRADAASNLSFEDVVSGNGSSDTAVSSSLVSLRQQYAALAATVGSLETQLGTRHPRLLAARSSLESLADEIRNELRRRASSARAEYDQAKKAEDAVAKELAVQKALQVNSSDKLVELNELQRKATAAREIYETVLKRTSQTSEEQNLTQNNIRVISEAEPPVKPDGPGRSVLMIAGLMGGLFAGFGFGAVFAVFASLFRHPVIRSYFR
ncbi:MULTISPECIES: GumC family protein [unclassified Sinorhizobium]|uniref:GumC family protein n=1 Tax=unclassified Sinorhizobium TaxID=2613772 RepID=UPI003526B24F